MCDSLQPFTMMAFSLFLAVITAAPMHMRADVTKMFLRNVIPIAVLFGTISSSSFIHPVTEETYDVLLKLCKNEFNVPVRERTNVQKAAVVKFWRSNGKFTNEGNSLYYGGKKVRIVIILTVFPRMSALPRMSAASNERST